MAQFRHDGGDFRRSPKMRRLCRIGALGRPLQRQIARSAHYRKSKRSCVNHLAHAPSGMRPPAGRRADDSPSVGVATRHHLTHRTVENINGRDSLRTIRLPMTPLPPQGDSKTAPRDGEIAKATLLGIIRNIPSTADAAPGRGGPLRFRTILHNIGIDCGDEGGAHFCDSRRVAGRVGESTAR